MVIEHFKEDQAFLSNMDSLDLGNLDHSDIADMLVDHVYKNYDSFILLLSGSKEDALENGIDEFVEILEQSTIAMVSGSKFYTYDPFMTHWMAHTTVDSMVHVIKHEKDVNVAKKRIQSIMNYLVIGWVKLVMVPIDGDKDKKKKKNN